MNNQNQPGTIQGTDTTVPSSQAGAPDATGDVVIPEYQEELVPETVEQQEGMVHVHKDVVQEQQTVSAPVTHEQVEVERVLVHNQLDTAPPDAFQGEDIDIPVKGEQLVADKQIVETEEVRLHKKQVQEQEQVSGTVRREEVEVDQPGQTATTGTMTAAQAAPVDTTSSAMQATPTTATAQNTMTESAPVRITTDESATSPAATVVQEASSAATGSEAAMQSGTTYRIEATPVDDAVAVGQTGNMVETTAQANGSQTTSGARQGASNAKDKVDGMIDTVTDKLFGHNS